MAELNIASMLAVTAYAGGDHARTVIAAIELLQELHGARCLTFPDIDSRCRTCLDGRGRPAPWPCLTYQQFGALFGVAVPAVNVSMFHTFGQARNGSRRALARIKSGLALPAVEA